MSFDWKAAVGAVAPALATVLGGPLAGGAVSVLADKLLGGSSGDPVADEAKLAGVLSGGMTPELRAKVMEADTTVRLAAIAAATKGKEIEADVEKAYLADTDAARHAHAQNIGVLRLGYLINVASYACVAGVLYGCFSLMNGSKFNVDPGIAATIGAVVGGVVQWLMANAAQANGFFFGSSPGSRDMARDLGRAVAAVQPVQRKP